MYVIWNLSAPPDYTDDQCVLFKRTVISDFDSLSAEVFITVKGIVYCQVDGSY